MGYPYPVLNDGKLHLPLVDPINVTGLTVAEAQRAVSTGYMGCRGSNQTEYGHTDAHAQVQINVTVVHNDPFRSLRDHWQAKYSYQLTRRRC